METNVRRKTNSPDFSTAYFFLEGLTELGIESSFRIVPRSTHVLEALSYDKSGPVFDTVVPAPEQ